MKSFLNSAFTKAVLAPFVGGVIAGNIAWHGFSLLTKGQFAFQMASTPDWINAAAGISATVAAGVIGYALGNRANTPAP